MTEYNTTKKTVRFVALSQNRAAVRARDVKTTPDCPLWVFLLRCHTQVTISLALTIVTLLSIFWALLQMIPNIHYKHHYYNFHEYYEDNVTETATPWTAYHQVIYNIIY